MQGNVPRLREIIEPIKISEMFLHGKYVQSEHKKEPIWCHVIPLNLHQKQKGLIHNFFGIVCNINVEIFDIGVWNNKYIKINSSLQPINKRYGYFFAKEITQTTLLNTENIHITNNNQGI